MTGVRYVRFRAICFLWTMLSLLEKSYWALRYNFFLVFTDFSYYTLLLCFMSCFKSCGSLDPKYIASSCHVDRLEKQLLEN